MNRREAILASGATLLAAPAVRAQGATWPDREITILVAYGAGGSTDVCTRALAGEAEKILGVPVQIVNRTGGQGTSAPAQVASMRPDGHTLATAGMAALAILPHVLDLPYTLDSFTFLPGYARYLYGIAVPAESPIRTAQDLIAQGRQRRVTFAAAGAPQNIGMFELNKKLNTRFGFVPFPGGAEAVTAAIGRHVDFVVQNPPEMLPALQSGRLRLIASASDVRWKEYPDVQTLREQGVDLAVDSVLGLVGPKGIPQDRLERLNTALLQAARSPGVGETVSRFGMVPAPTPATEFEAMQRGAFAEFGPHLRENGLARR
ncbi:Bug family tripartite tricarboxylate transporter substrate binding protein [Sabulicella glaciei]|uniref:Tripartite tricarboxylate transporter substrate binding protein n=1 Tax=Sabulicella glaciei TaxID=2984948 RepID=A0ABT3NPY7_9PROT|nr:tripartite tricarboxylate transporter substrate binding protein [Roseococcus sp. MDT2-1-1]MCW8084230.1 tripartite tricarboxylate transporter substrate binding protein [Roseococcus sp. MDT2-1-1]